MAVIRASELNDATLRFRPGRVKVGQLMPIRGRVMTLWIIAAAFGIVLVLVAARHLGKPRVIASAVAPDGTEMGLVQQCNWGPELFTTSFVYRKPGANWGRFYYDHEDGYWSGSRVVMETNKSTAVFYRDEVPTVTFRWETETYTLHRFDRTLTGAQFSLPAGWSPKQSVYSPGAQR